MKSPQREIEIEIGKKVEERDLEVVNKLVLEADKLRRKQQEAEALAAFEAILAEHPDTPRAPTIMLSMGSCYLDLGKADMAIAQYEKILSEYPDFKSMPTVFYAMGIAYKDAKEYEKALESYKVVIDRWPHTGHAAHAAFTRAKLLRRQEKYAQAIKEGESMIDDAQLKSADHWKKRLMEMKASCLFKLGESDKAKAELVARVNRFGADAADLLTLSSVYLQAGQYQSAKAMLRRIITQYGWGLMQLDPPPSESVIWSWTANRTAGCDVLSDKYNWGLGYPQRLRNRYGGNPNIRDWNSDEERWKDGYQLYNGGHAWRFHFDDPDNKNTSTGYWEPYPSCSGYGVDAWNIQQNVEGGNPPPSW